MMLILKPTALLRSVTTRTMLGVLCLAAPSPVCAQRTTAATPSAVSAPATSPHIASAVDDGRPQSADQVRDQLSHLLQDHPPTVRVVLLATPVLLYVALTDE